MFLPVPLKSGCRSSPHTSAEITELFPQATSHQQLSEKNLASCLPWTGYGLTSSLCAGFHWISAARMSWSQDKSTPFLTGIPLEEEHMPLTATSGRVQIYPSAADQRESISETTTLSWVYMLGYITGGGDRLCPSHWTSSQMFSHKNTSMVSNEATWVHPGALSLGQQMLEHCKNHLIFLLPFSLLLLKTFSSICKKCHLVLGLNLPLEELEPCHVESQHILQRQTSTTLWGTSQASEGAESCTGHPLLRDDEDRKQH